jgi:type I restriction enzyme, S subunit
MVSNKQIKRSYIPNDWIIEKIGNFTEVRTGGTPSKQNPEYWGGDIKWMSSGEVNLKRIRDVSGRITKKGLENSNARYLPKGTVMIALNGQGKTRGTVAILETEVTCNQSLAGFLPSEKHEPYYLFYNLESRYKEIRGLTGDGARTGLNLAILRELEVPLPPIKEQRKIAAILSSVDEAIEKTEAIIEQTEKVKKGLMQQLLTKGIGHTKFKKTKIGDIPEQWEIRKLNQVSTRITEKNKGKTDRVLTISGLHGLVSQTEYFNKSVASKNIDGYYYLKKGDFAYNKSYSDGYPLGAIKMLERYPDGVVSTLYICFRINENMCKDYFRYYFESNLWNSEVSAIAPEGGRSHGLLNVGVNDFFNIFIPIPPIEEQYKISSIIRSVENKEKLELEKLEKLKTIKMGLMQVLLTGKVRVKVDDEVMSQ